MQRSPLRAVLLAVIAVGLLLLGGGLALVGAVLGLKPRRQRGRFQA